MSSPLFCLNVSTSFPPNYATEHSYGDMGIARDCYPNYFCEGTSQISREVIDIESGLNEKKAAVKTICLNNNTISQPPDNNDSNSNDFYVDVVTDNEKICESLSSISSDQYISYPVFNKDFQLICQFL